MTSLNSPRICRLVALRKESVDRNHVAKYHLILPLQSLSARRAWIEITVEEVQTDEEQVALRKESVDRNNSRILFRLLIKVALRKESVDRNKRAVSRIKVCIESLSARRAWIEI